MQTKRKKVSDTPTQKCPDELINLVFKDSLCQASLPLISASFRILTVFQNRNIFHFLQKSENFPFWIRESLPLYISAVFFSVFIH